MAGYNWNLTPTGIGSRLATSTGRDGPVTILEEQYRPSPGERRGMSGRLVIGSARCSCQAAADAQTFAAGWKPLARWAREVAVAAHSTEIGGEDSKGDLRQALPLWKRALDLFCLFISLPVTLPLGLCIAAYIKLVSAGPALFRQERVGFRGRRFVCLKFRTMRVNADQEAHARHLRALMQRDAPLTKLDAAGDPRLIPGGALLRATGLDELPQLINVLLGEMSLVGPRPCIPYEYEILSEHDKQRFEAVPGLTGLWQVSGKNKTTFSQMIELDIRYARTKSLWLDLKIMARTFSALAAQVRETRQAAPVAAAPTILPTPRVSRETL